MTFDGRVECEASILNVKDGKYASMASLENVINPIKGVEALYLNQINETLSNGRISPIFVCGPGSTQWCKDNNIPIHDAFKLSANQQNIFNQYSKIINKGCSDLYTPPIKKRKLNENINEKNEIISNHGTCGVIGFDVSTKTMFVTTSSGGIWMKNPGRIGPSALIGSGFDGFYDDTKSQMIGCCASGSGEYFMQFRLSQEIISEIRDNQNGHNIMDENVLYGVFKRFRTSVSASNDSLNRTAGCLLMKIVGCLLKYSLGAQFGDNGSWGFV